MTDLLISVPEGSSVQVIVNGSDVTRPSAGSDSDYLAYTSKASDLCACYDEPYVRELELRAMQQRSQNPRPWDMRACDDASFIDDLTHGRLL